MNSTKYLTIFILITLSACVTNSREKVTVTNVSLDGTWTIIKTDCLDKCQDRVKMAAQTYVGKDIEIDGTYLEFPALQCLTTEFIEPDPYPNKEKLIADDSRLQKLAFPQEEVMAYSVRCGRYAFNVFWPKDTATAYIVANVTGVFLTLMKTPTLKSTIGNVPEPSRDFIESSALVFRGEPFEVRSPKSKKTEPERGFKMVTVFYGTDRNKTGSDLASERHGDKRNEGFNKIEYGFCRVAIPDKHKKGSGEFESPKWYSTLLLGESAFDPEKHITLLTATPISSKSTFFKMVQKTASNKEVLVYIHGYNNSFEDAARRTAQLAFDLDFSGRAFFFSWPVPIVYSLTEKNEGFAKRHLKEFLREIVSSSGAEKIHLIAHSRGTSILSYALKEIVYESPESRPKFNQIFLAAPDIDVDDFKEEIAPAIKQIADRITVYASSKDEALTVSGWDITHEYPRLGLLTKTILPIVGIEMVDASELGDVLADKDFLNHSYLGALLKDVREAMSGASLKVRSLIPRPRSDKPTYWAIKPLQ